MVVYIETVVSKDLELMLPIETYDKAIEVARSMCVSLLATEFSLLDISVPPDDISKEMDAVCGRISRELNTFFATSAWVQVHSELDWFTLQKFSLELRLNPDLTLLSSTSIH